jgi:hypothetical protein
VRIHIRQAVERWLAGIVELGDVDVQSEEGELRVTVGYRVVDTLTDHDLELRVR